MDLENLLRRRLLTLFSQPVSVLCHLTEVLTVVCMELPVCQFFARCLFFLLLHNTEKNLVPIHFTPAP